MSRKLNFNAGPAGLPLAVLEEAREQFIDFKGTGMSLIEHSHRGKAYEAVHQEAIATFSELLEVPSSHGVMLMQGGASLQFAMVPMNFLPQDASADYLLTGHWAKIAFAEAGKLGKVRAAADSVDDDKLYTRLPEPSHISIDSAAAYVHMTSNNTIFGTQYHSLPDVNGRPLVSDMSSDILSRPLDVGRHALIYAGAQKNLGPSGLTVIIVSKDFLKKARSTIPDILRYQKHLDAGSLYHTPPSFAVYLFGLNLKWIKANGGAQGMERRKRAKSECLYGALERLSGFYRAPVAKNARSWMNVVFRTPNAELDDLFCAEASKQAMEGLKGHRSAGGIRASLYNALSLDDVKSLVAFMDDFAKRKG